MTETQLPQPIGWSDVRVDDVIRAERDSGATRVVQGEVETINADWMSLDGGNSVAYIYAGDGFSLTLISRPTPERPPWSRWRDPVTGNGYVVDDTGDYLRVVTNELTMPVLSPPRTPGLGVSSVIARLVPWSDEPAQPDPILCVNCDQPIRKGDDRWYHVRNNFMRCDGLPLAQIAAPVQP